MLLLNTENLLKQRVSPKKNKSSLVRNGSLLFCKPMRKIKNYYKSNLRCQIINYSKRILYLRFDFLYLLCIQLDLDAKRKGIIRLL